MSVATAPSPSITASLLPSDTVESGFVMGVVPVAAKSAAKRGRKAQDGAKEGDKNSRFLGEDSSLSVYLREISKTKSLSMDAEADLSRRIRLGDKRALHTLVQANLKFVVSVCRNYQNQGLPLTDLINEGNLGLIRAAKRFDETKQFKFISYAVWWIRQAILSALAEQSRIINIPLNRVGTLHKIGRMSAQLEQKLGRHPNSAELAEALCIGENEIHESLQLSNAPMSLDAPVQSDEDSKLADVLEDENSESPDKGSLDQSLTQEIRGLLGTLEEREEQVIKLYFGIGVDTAHTLEEIAQRFNLTRERVRQIKEKALKRLKHPMRKRRLVAFQP